MSTGADRTVPFCGHLALLALVAAACGVDVDRLQVDPTPRAERPASAIQVLLDEPRQPYQSIALIAASGDDVHSLRLLTRALVAEAARLGGDAILVSGRSGKNGLQARVIVFTK